MKSLSPIVFAVLALPVVWGFSSTGVPCYLHPSGSACHYQQKPDSPACTNPKTRVKLELGVVQLNRTLYSLEQQLIHLGVIPPDNACSELPHVENGGVVYTDLNLAPGCTGKYICNEGYSLHSLFGHKEFSCTEDGVWDGNVTMVPVVCVLMVGKCDPPNEISNGNMTFTDNDSENVLPGDMVSYACDDDFDLVGPETRFCLRNGNWSGVEPDCIEKKKKTDDPQAINQNGMIAGISVLSALLALVIVATVISVTVFIAIKCGRPAYAKLNERRVYSPTRSLIVSDESPSHPSYVSGHAILSGAAAESERNRQLSSSGESVKSKSSKKSHQKSSSAKSKQSGSDLVESIV